MPRLAMTMSMSPSLSISPNAAPRLDAGNSPGVPPRGRTSTKRPSAGKQLIFLAVGFRRIAYRFDECNAAVSDEHVQQAVVIKIGKPEPEAGECEARCFQAEGGRGVRKESGAVDIKRVGLVAKV